MRWIVSSMGRLLGLAGVLVSLLAWTGAGAAERPIVVAVEAPSAVVAPPPPRWSKGLARSPVLHESFHIGQVVGVGLLSLGWAGAGFGLVGFSSHHSYAVYGAAALAGIGGALGAIGAGAALGAATSLRRDGGAVTVVPGWIGVGAGLLGIGLVGLAFLEPRLVLAALATVPVVLIGGTGQLIANGVASRRFGIGVAPLPEGGAATALTVRF